MATEAVPKADWRHIGRHGSLELRIPDCPHGIGGVIAAKDSPQLIDGVRIEPVALWPDDRGYFLEVQRMGRGLAAKFPAESTQVSAALNYPGAIKAFHYHLRQTDCWTPAHGPTPRSSARAITAAPRAGPSRARRAASPRGARGSRPVPRPREPIAAGRRAPLAESLGCGKRTGPRASPPVASDLSGGQSWRT